MDKLSIRKEIAALINSIKEHSDNIGNKDHIPQLELELILHKIEKLYQKSIVFNHLNSTSDLRDRNAIEQISQEESIPVKKEEVVKEETPVDLFGTIVTEKPKTEKKIEKKDASTSLSTSEKREQVSVTKIHKPAIEDLRAAIGINDKFLFANELFGGVMSEYEIAIHQLNTAGSLESAMDYFISLQPLYNWDMENEIVKRMSDLIDRRYS